MIERVPKIHGADVELGNSVLGLRPAANRQGTGREASRALLREIEGIPHRAVAETTPRWQAPASSDSGGWGAGWGWHDATADATWDRSEPRDDAQDWGRKFLPENGGCVYIDLDHLELALPETLSAFDHVAAWHAMLRLAQGALARANEKLPDGQRILALANNSDGLGQSYGSHISFSVTRRAWSHLFHRKLHHLLVLASYLASSIVLTGAGKVGSENGRRPVGFQLSQRADFFEMLVGPQTTFHRPLVNARDEALADPLRLARLHLINFDSGLCQVASLLKVGPTQIVLAMFEAEEVDLSLALEDPVEALQLWSHDVSLSSTVRLITGEAVTALDLQRRFFERAARFVERGEVEGLVPRAGEIVDLWGGTLELLVREDWTALARRLDWVLKRSLLERTRQRHGLEWDDPKLKWLDHLYSSLDTSEGLYWTCERAGVVERLVSESDVRRFELAPPADTRAWGRARLLDLAGPERITSVDWHQIDIRPDEEREPLRVLLPDPARGTEAELGAVLAAGLDFGTALRRLGAEPVPRRWSSAQR